MFVMKHPTQKLRNTESPFESFVIVSGPNEADRAAIGLFKRKKQQDKFAKSRTGRKQSGYGQTCFFTQQMKVAQPETISIRK
jgi:hypothetical protein